MGAARALAPREARARVLEKYLAVRWAASRRDMERLFGWPRPDLEAAVERLIAEGRASLLTLQGGRTMVAAAGTERALRSL